MTDKNRAVVLDLTALAADIRCLTGAPECRCEGCSAVAAVHLAVEHLESGRLVDASVKLGHAAYLLPLPQLVLAAAQLERLLVATSCHVCGTPLTEVPQLLPAGPCGAVVAACGDCAYKASLRPEWLAGAELAP